MTKKDVVTEIIEDLIDKQIVKEDDRNIAIEIAMRKLVDFSLWVNAYKLEDD